MFSIIVDRRHACRWFQRSLSNKYCLIVSKTINSSKILEKKNFFCGSFLLVIRVNNPNAVIHPQFSKKQNTKI